MTLTCQVTGATGTVCYKWTSTCIGNCFVTGKTEQAVTSPDGLYSSDSGTHTCTATDSVGNMGSNAIVTNVVGKSSTNTDWQ